jgi:hypothetical protein
MAGSVSIHTGMRPGKFAITLNQRNTGTIISNIYQIAFRGALPVGYLIRKVLEEENDFMTAVRRLSSAEITAPCYYTVSGTGKYDGVIITRDGNSTVMTNWLDDSTWFLVQTNYDRFLTDPAKDRRRIPAE